MRFLLILEIIVITLMNLISIIDAACPNMCNNQGTCGEKDVCQCFEGFEGPDCSYRICPFDTAWADRASSEDVGHGLLECSGKGYCNRANGQCVCDEGFVGKTCNRLDCFDSCNKRGLCVTMNQYSTEHRNENSVQYTYSTRWDSDRISGCTCDFMYGGYDCSELVCPDGDDPLTLNQLNEIQIFTCTGTLGSFKLYYKGKPTPSIPHTASEADVKTALETIDGISNVFVTFSIPNGAACQTIKNVIKVEFLEQFGVIPLMVGEADGVMTTASGVVTVVGKGSVLQDGANQVLGSQAGTKEDEDCAGRGYCISGDGICVCYLSNGDSYASSDGYGGPGNRGDCGFVNSKNPISTCPGETECSGHGMCDKTGDSPTFRCTCAYGWTGGDCSARTCPLGRSWFEYPTANEIAHQTMVECSNMGLCIGDTGQCNCRNGFYGQACEYSHCPGIDSSKGFDCSGHGICLSMFELAQRDLTHFDIPVTTTYGLDPNEVSTWETHRVHSCLCDDDYEGHDCSRVKCPLGDDPLTNNDKPERQVLKCTATSGTFSLSFRGQKTKTMDVTRTTLDVITSYFTSLSTVDEISIQLAYYNSTSGLPYKAPTGELICSSSGDRYVVFDFLLNFGNVPAIQITKSIDVATTLYKAGTTIAGSFTTWDGTTEGQPCSNRGLCDYETGQCTCFTEFYSSDGKGARGSRGDCGFSIISPTTSKWNHTIV